MNKQIYTLDGEGQYIVLDHSVDYDVMCTVKDVNTGMVQLVPWACVMTLEEYRETVSPKYRLKEGA